MPEQFNGRAIIEENHEINEEQLAESRANLEQSKKFEKQVVDDFVNHEAERLAEVERLESRIKD